MRKVVPLHLGHVLRQPGVVQGVVHAVVEDVEGERAGDDAVGDACREDEVCEVGERRLEQEEQRRRHDESQSVHREVVVDAVQEEVEHERPVSIGEVVVDVEEESVERVLEDGPDDVAREEADHGGCEGCVGGHGQGGQIWRHLHEVLGRDGAAVSPMYRMVRIARTGR